MKKNGKEYGWIRRGLALALVIVMTLCILPAAAQAEGEAAADDNGLVVNKTVAHTGEGNAEEFTLSLEAYATGTQISVDVPADVILVLDQTASMFTPMGLANWQNGYELFKPDGYTGLEKYTIADGSFVADSGNTDSSVPTLEQLSHRGYLVGQSKTLSTFFCTGASHWWHDCTAAGNPNKDSSGNCLGCYPWYLVKYDANDTATPWQVYMLSTSSFSTYTEAYKNTNGYKNLYNAADYETNKGFLFKYATLEELQTATGVDVFYKTQYGALYDSISQFISDLKAANAGHRVAMVGYSGGVLTSEPMSMGSGLFNGSTFVKAFDQTGNIILGTADENSGLYKNYNSALTTAFMSVDDGTAMKALNALDTNYINTCQNVGMQIALDIFEANPIPENEKRNRSIILFTDGVPSSDGEFDETEVQTLTVDHAATAKQTYGSTIYTVCTSTATTGGAVPAFIDYASSNYPDAAVSSNGTIVPGTAADTKYTKIVANVAKMISEFQEMAKDSVTNAALNVETVLQDTIPDNFDIAGEIKVHAVSAGVDDNGNITFKGTASEDITSQVTVTCENGVVQVSGFDYAANYVTAEGHVEDGEVIDFYGKKLVVEVPIARSESNPGGNEQATNVETASGIYVSGQLVEAFPLPHVDTSRQFTVKKEVVGTAYDEGQSFDFKVTYTQITDFQDTTPEDQTPSGNYVEAVTELVEEQPVTLTNNDSITLDHIHADSQVIISEIPAGIYTVMVGEQEIEVVDGEATFTIDSLTESTEIVFTNIRKTANVSVDKQVTGNMGDISKKFSFTATLTDIDGTALDFPAQENAAVTVDGNTATFQLSHNDEVVVLNDIPVGAKLVVSEMPENYFANVSINDGEAISLEQDADHKVHAELTVAENSANKVVFTNSYNVLINTGIVLDSLPYILILAVVAAAGVFLILRKRRSDED